MKHSILLSILTISLLISCKKDKSEPKIIDNRPPEEVIETLTEQLSEADSISSFTNALKTISLNEEETAQGLTVFAPLNEGAVSISQQKNISSTSSVKAGTSADSAVLSEAVLKDHIVKGVLKTADLTNGKNLTTLSGKKLRITRDGDKLWINGVLISGAEITSGTKEAIYVVQKRLNNTTVTDTPAVAGSFEIVVWNTLMWSPTQPKGEIAADADVVLYRSHQDYADGKPAYQGKTNADGRVRFHNVPAGRYYIEVSKDDISNIFFESAQKENGVYKGLAAAEIFQSAADMDTAAVQAGDAVPGNFRWIDMNSDGIINNSDFTALPYESAEARNGLNVQVSILIGYENNMTMGPVRTESQALSLLSDAENALNSWHKDMVMLDGVLSDDAESPAPPYNEINSFTFNPSNSIITQNWIKAYQNISNLNKLIQGLSGVSINNKEQVLAQAKALRAYIYLQLLTYYGNVPLQTEQVLDVNASNNNRQQVYDLVKNDLITAAAALPASGSNTTKLSSTAVRALSAKAALLGEDYADAMEYTDAVINSGQYQLVSTSSIFTAGSKETIWDNSGSLSNLFKTYFDNRTICPYVRLAEIYLIGAEANLASGNTTPALTYLNMVRGRRGMNIIDQGVSSDSIRNAIRITWKAEMPKEGNRFANLVRWQTASQVLGSKGFTAPKHQMLPIPQLIIDQYPNIIQNPGY